MESVLIDGRCGEIAGQLPQKFLKAAADRLEGVFGQLVENLLDQSFLKAGSLNHALVRRQRLLAMALPRLMDLLAPVQRLFPLLLFPSSRHIIYFNQRR